MQTILLVDGYNMVGAWPSLQRLRDRDSLEAARGELVELLTNYTAFRGYRTVLVFDAQMVVSPLVWQVQPTGIEICFTEHEQTADTFIEQYSYQLLRSQVGRVIVATSDRAQQLLILAQGAAWFSADHLRQDVQLAYRQMREQLRSTSRRRQGSRRVMDSLDPKTVERLSKWQHGT